MIAGKPLVGVPSKITRRGFFLSLCASGLTLLGSVAVFRLGGHASRKPTSQPNHRQKPLMVGLYRSYEFCRATNPEQMREESISNCRNY